MSSELVALVAILLFLVLILTEMPVALAVMVSGLFGIAMITSLDKAGLVLRSAPYNTTASFTLSVIPMYVLLGALISNAGIGAAIYRACNRLVGRLPGGLAATAVVSTSIFSGISGSSAADVATFGRISVTEMHRHGYDRAYAAAVVAAAGAFAFLIPPSITLVIYGIMAEQPIGALILAGFIPGIFSALALVAYVVYRAWRGAPGAGNAGSVASPGMAVSDSTSAPSGDSAAVGFVAARAAALRPLNALRDDVTAMLYAAVIFLIVIGGLYSGVFTATESAAVGAFAALIIAAMARHYHGGRLGTVVVQSLREAADVTSMIFLLLIGGAVFGFMMASSGLPAAVVSWATGLQISPKLLVALFLLLLIPLGMFLDGLTIMVLTVPIVAPVMKGLGVDGIWFGILFAKMIEIGLLTPPVGLNVYVISGIMKIPAESVFRQMMPFLVLDVAVTAVLFAFPEIITWLPAMSGLK